VSAVKARPTTSSSAFTIWLEARADIRKLPENALRALLTRSGGTTARFAPDLVIGGARVTCTFNAYRVVYRTNSQLQLAKASGLTTSPALA